MNRSAQSLVVLAALALLVFGWGLWQLFTIRFETGDVYPPYSSLRADPLGTKALHDGLEATGTIRVGRNFRPLERLSDPRGTTVFWLGDPHDITPPADWRNFLRGGGRLVVAWTPSQFVERTRTNAAGPLPWQQARYRQGPLLPRDPLSMKPEDIAFREQWQLGLAFVALPASGAAFEADSATLAADLPLPAEIPWHSTVCFTNLHADWRIIYERQGQPVMIERKIGEGTVVVSTDAWLVSNEALRRGRETEFLAWLVGGNPRVVFDEHHLGVEANPGLAGMLRRYRMHGIIGAFLALALLFVWRNSASFLPRQRTGELATGGPDIAGRDAASGFVNLLRRGVPRNDLLKVCFTEWKQSLAASGGCSKERLDRMEKVMLSHDDFSASERNPVATYRELHRAWKEQR